MELLPMQTSRPALLPVPRATPVRVSPRLKRLVSLFSVLLLLAMLPPEGAAYAEVRVEESISTLA